MKMKKFFCGGANSFARSLFGVIVFLGVGGALGQTQVDVGGIMTANYVDGGDGNSPLQYNYGLPGFELIGDLFMNVRISDEASVLLELETWHGWEVRLYSGSFTYKVSGERLKIEAGKFAAPFGNFLPRRFAPQNFVYSYPLYYEQRTGLTTTRVPTTPEELLNIRGSGGYDNGIPLISRQAYLTGVQFFGKLGKWGYHFGLANGALSNPTNMNESKRPLLVGRLNVQPAIGLVIGVSAANGGYLKDASVKSQNATVKPDKQTQTLAGADLEYSRGYFVFWGESVWSRWQSPFIHEHLDARAFSAELRYKIRPRLFVAGRYGRTEFSKIADTQDVDADLERSEPWEYPVWRFESAVGYNLSRHTLVKAVWQINRTDVQNPRHRDPADNLLALQMTMFY
ncbi:MAG: hypothetical protein ALAOOOJD_02561 [bacterium]|nr:hypothetical protein [bacterium]